MNKLEGRIEGLYTAITPSGYHAPLDEVDFLALLTLDPVRIPRRPNRPSVQDAADFLILRFIHAGSSTRGPISNPRISRPPR